MRKKMPYKKKLYALIAVILCLCFVLSVTGMTWLTTASSQQNMDGKIDKLVHNIGKRMRVIENSQLDDMESSYLAGLELAELCDSVNQESFGAYYSCEENGTKVAECGNVVYLHGYDTYLDDDRDKVYQEVLQFRFSLDEYLSQKQIDQIENICATVEGAVVMADGAYENYDFVPSEIYVLAPEDAAEEKHVTGEKWENTDEISVFSDQDVDCYRKLFSEKTNADVTDLEKLPKGITLESEIFFSGEKQQETIAFQALNNGTTQKTKNLLHVTQTGTISVGKHASITYSFSGEPLKQAISQLWLVYIALLCFYLAAAAILYGVMHVIFARQEQWNWSQKMLTRAIAHELKTPLSIIQGYCEGLQFQEDRERQKEYVQTITQETKEMDKLVLDMLELSRLETTGYKIEPEEIALQDLLQAVVRQYASVYEEKEVEVKIEGAENIYFEADLSCMYKAISNLFGNAMKHVPDQGKIYVKAEKIKEKTYIRIYNNGPEIPEEVRSHIWDGYHKVQKENKGKIRSTGLGLTIVKYMLDLHGFSYGCENKHPGVEFWIGI